MKASQKQPAVDVLGVELDDLLVLLDRPLEHLLVDVVGLLVTDQAGVEAASTRRASMALGSLFSLSSISVTASRTLPAWM